VYCIIEAALFVCVRPIGHRRVIHLDVYTVHTRTWRPLCRYAALEVLDSTPRDIVARARADVNETVMREHTVIPMSFGTIFKTREDIVELLRSAAEAFGDVLDKMQNKLEFGLKILWDREQAIRRGRGADEDISRLKKEISTQKDRPISPVCSTAASSIPRCSRSSERYVAEILDQLRDVSVASRINKPIGDKMIMNPRFSSLAIRSRRSTRRFKSIASRFEQADIQVHGPVAAL